MNDIERDAMRYRWLREGPEDRRVLEEGLPWIVHIAPIHGIPTMVSLSSIELDAAIDRQLTNHSES